MIIHRAMTQGAGFVAESYVKEIIYHFKNDTKWFRQVKDSTLGTTKVNIVQSMGGR